MIKNTCSILFVLILTIQSIVAQGFDVPKMKELKGKKLEMELTPMQNKKGLWGYVDVEGKFVIKPVFTEACPYEGNVARVKVDNLWGVIGDNGLYNVNPTYSEIQRFSQDSIAIAVRNGLYYSLIDTRGMYVNNNIYGSIENADYGYVVMSDDKYGTLDVKGQVLQSPQFDKIVDMERRRGNYGFLKDGKWGVLHNGSEILAHKWDCCPTLLREGDDHSPSFFIATLDGKIGVIASDGRYITPSMYDDIYLHNSENYYITVKDGCYGALSLTFSEIMPSIYSTPPYVTKELHRVYDGKSFYAANIKGSIGIEHCSDLFLAFRPDDYATTTELPEWMKNATIEENIAAREEKIYEARVISKRLADCGYDVYSIAAKGDISEDIHLSFNANDQQKYGVVRSIGFTQKNTSLIYNSAMYKAQYCSSDDRVSLITDTSTSEHYFLVNSTLYSLREIIEGFNIKTNKGVYPKSVTYTANGEILVRMAFVRARNEVSQPIIESDESKLPVRHSNISIYTGNTTTVDCSDVVILLSANQPKASFCIEVATAGTSSLIASKFSGFYTTTAKGMLANSKSPIRKYNNRGESVWLFYPSGEEQIYDIEETENYIYICGSTKASGTQRPLLVQISKDGKRIKEWEDGSEAHYASGVKCDGYLLYTKHVASDKSETNYYPRYVMEDLSDDIGVRPCCVWEDWGGKELGGCGLIGHDGKWLQTPILTSSQECAAYFWEFKEFHGDILIARHLGKYGVIDRNGNIILDTIYEKIEYLSNPNYLRVTKEGAMGVVSTDGRVIVPLKYNYIGDMSENLIIVRSGWLYGCYNKEGEMVIPCDYSSMSEFKNGMTIAGPLKKLGYMNNKGEFIIEPFADEAYHFSDGCARVVVDGRTGYIDIDGNWVIEPTYDGGGNSSIGIIPVMTNGKFSYITKDMHVISKVEYTTAEDFDPEYRVARVSNNNKWGIINEVGREIIPVQYDILHILPDGYIYVEKNKKCGVYTTGGALCFPTKYNRVQYEVGEPLYGAGYITISSDTEVFRIDKQGNNVYNYSSFSQ